MSGGAPHLRDRIAANPFTGAWFSADAERLHRYALWRVWDREKPVLLVSMLNPSTADHRKNDPTILRVIAFAKRDGFGGIIVLNAYAFRSPHPAVMRAAADPDGPENDLAKRQAVEYAAELAGPAGPAVLMAHGTGGGEGARKTFEIVRAAGARVFCLGVTQAGHPKHPLARGHHRVPDDAPLIPWSPDTP